MNITVALYRTAGGGIIKDGPVDYQIPYTKGMTVLDIFLYVYKYLDATLGFRYECRQGICGTCGVMLNGVPVLACATQIDPKITRNTIEPLAQFPIEKDLIVDLTGVLKRYLSIKPFIERIQQVRMSKQVADKSKSFRKCIECGCCIAGAASVPKDGKVILNPMELVKLARFFSDPRDRGERKITARQGGVEEYSEEEGKRLAQLCPRGVPIDAAIRLLQD